MDQLYPEDPLPGFSLCQHNQSVRSGRLSFSFVMNILKRDDHPFELHLSEPVDSFPGELGSGPCSLLSVGLHSRSLHLDRKHLVLVVDFADTESSWRKDIMRQLQGILDGLRTVDLVSVIRAGRNPETLCLGGEPEEAWRAVRAAERLPHHRKGCLREAWIEGIKLAAYRFFPDGRTRVVLVSAASDRLIDIRELAAGFAEDGIPTDVMLAGNAEKQRPEERLEKRQGQILMESIQKASVSLGRITEADPLLASFAEAAGGRIIHKGMGFPFERDGHDEEEELRHIRIEPVSMTLGWRRAESIRGQSGDGLKVRFRSLRPGDRCSVLVWGTPGRRLDEVSMNISWAVEDGREMARVDLFTEEADPDSDSSAKAAVTAYRASLALDRVLDERPTPSELAWHAERILKITHPFRGDKHIDRLILLTRALIRRF